MNRTFVDKHRAMTKLATALSLSAALAVAACEDDDDIDIIEPLPIVGTVTTFVDSTVNFSQMQTFTLPDTVIHFAPLTGTPLAVSRAFDRAILDRVHLNLLARGYTPEPNPDSIAPDFVVLVGATATENHLAFVSYPWFSIWGFYSGFGWFVPGFDDDWGITYPWAGVGVASFPRGTLIVDLIPTLSVNPLDKDIRSAWAGVATALLNTGVTTIGVNAAIDQMFALSPYLRSDPNLP